MSKVKMEEIERNHLLKAALTVETIVFVVALAFIYIFKIDVLRLLAFSFKDLIVVIVAMVVLTILNFLFVFFLPRYIPFLKSVRKSYDYVCGFVINADWFAIVVIALFSGIAEEVLFRGAFQQQFGIVIASVLFGLCHVATRETIVYGLYAVVIGFIMGGLLIYTGSLLVPILVHIINNAIAIPVMQWNYRKNILTEFEDKK